MTEIVRHDSSSLTWSPIKKLDSVHRSIQHLSNGTNNVPYLQNTDPFQTAKGGRVSVSSGVVRQCRGVHTM